MRRAVAVILCLASVCQAEASVLPTVEVIGRYEDAIGVSDAASEGTVTREGVEKRPLLRPGELLEALPGMIVTQHSGDGKANQFFLEFLLHSAWEGREPFAATKR